MGLIAVFAEEGPKGGWVIQMVFCWWVYSWGGRSKIARRINLGGITKSQSVPKPTPWSAPDPTVWGGCVGGSSTCGPLPIFTMAFGHMM